MAEPSPTTATQGSNPQPSEPETLNPNPNPPNSQPDSTQPSSSTPPLPPPPPPSINPNSNPNPNLASPLPPQITPYGTQPPPMGSTALAGPPPAALSFRPAGAPAPIPAPQFTPIPQNPNLQGYPGVPPPGVNSAQPLQHMFAAQPMYPGQPPNPALRPPYIAMPNGYMHPTVPQGTVPPPVS